jgi:hypothetical protein
VSDLQDLAQFRRRLLLALAAGLPRGGVVLALGLPGQAAAVGLERPDSGHRLVEALSGDLLATRAGFAESLLSDPGGRIVVGDRVAGGRAGRGTALGAGIVPARAASLRQRRFADLLGELRGPVLVMVDAEADRGTLVQPALAALAREGAPLWMDLDPATGAARAAALLADPAAEGFEIFALDPARGLVGLRPPRPEGDADNAALPTRPEALILVPRAQWSALGLRRLIGDGGAQSGIAAQTARLRAPAIRWLARGNDPALEAALLDAGRPPLVPPPADKLFLPVGKRVFADNRTRIGTHDDGTGLAVASGAHTVRLVFVPPAPGTFRLRVALVREPDRALALKIAGTLVAADWIGEWFQLLAQSPVRVTVPHRPLAFDLVPATGNAGLSLMIRGIELEYVEPDPAAAIDAAAGVALNRGE